MTKEIRYRTRHQLCLEILAQHGDILPHTWNSGDDEMGHPYLLRRRLDTIKEQYLLAVPSNTQVRDNDVWSRARTSDKKVMKKFWLSFD